MERLSSPGKKRHRWQTTARSVFTFLQAGYTQCNSSSWNHSTVHIGLKVRGNALNSYVGCAGFESRPGHQLSWQVFFFSFPQPLQVNTGIIPRLGHSFQTLSDSPVMSYHLSLYTFRTESVLKDTMGRKNTLETQWTLRHSPTLWPLKTQSKSGLLYDWWFTANQFFLEPSPLRFTTRDFFSA
jgi:hypothetical protein